MRSDREEREYKALGIREREREQSDRTKSKDK